MPLERVDENFLESFKEYLLNCYSIKGKDKTKLNPNTCVSYFNKVRAALRIEQKNFSVNSTQTFKLPKEVSLELSGFYFSGGSWGLYKFGAWGSVNFGIQKKLIKHKSTLSFNIRNILNSEIEKLEAVIPEQNLIQRSRSIYGYTNYSLSFTHSFGNDKVKGKRERSTGAEDERGRL